MARVVAVGHTGGDGRDVERHARETGWPWFLRGSGTCRRDPKTQATFYGPIVAEHFDASQNARSVLTWLQPPNLPTPFRSELFFATRFRAIDTLTVEVTNGVRAARFPQWLIAPPDGQFLPVTWTFSQATNWTTMADSDGWRLFAGEDPDSPALALVMGRQREPWPGAVNRCRGGYAGLPGKTNQRDYFVVSGNLRDELKPHESFVGRQFFVVGTRREVEARVANWPDRACWRSSNGTRAIGHCSTSNAPVARRLRRTIHICMRRQCRAGICCRRRTRTMPRARD